MRLKRKELMLFAAPLLVLASAGAGFLWSNTCPDICTAYAGDFNSYALGNKASFIQLASQINRCPQARQYVVHYKVVSGGTTIDDVHVAFEPSTSLLAYEPGNSADIQLWHNVNAPIIRTIAQDSGKMGALKQSGCYRSR